MSIGGSSGSSSSNSVSQEYSQSLGLQGSNQQLDQAQAAMQQFQFQQFQQYLQDNPGLAQGRGVPGRGALDQSQHLQRGGTFAQQRLGEQGELGTVNSRQLAQAAKRGDQGLEQLQNFSNTLNPFTQQQIGQLGQNLGDVFRNEILPGIGSGFQGAGQRGSSRQGVAEGLAAQGVLNQFQQGSTQLLNNAYGQAQQAATNLAGIGTGAAQTGANIGAGASSALTQSRIDASGNLIQGLPGLQQANTNQYLAGFQPFQVGSGIIGQPSTLGSSFGIDYGQAYGFRRSTGSSDDQSANLGLSFGGGSS
jgi:hypothetical protein